LELIEQGQVPRVPQDSTYATYAPALNRKDELVDWSNPAEKIRNHIRGLNPWPGAYTEFSGQMFKVWSAKLWESDQGIESLVNPGLACQPGEVVGVVKDTGLLVQTGQGLLLLTEVQPTSKQRMNAAAFSRGYQIDIGTILG
jgi:methionyl-tRNA formyltransferase